MSSQRLARSLAALIFTICISLASRVQAQQLFEDIYSNLSPTEGGSIATADYDADGELDLLLTGYGQGARRTTLYKAHKGPSGIVAYTTVETPFVGMNSSAASWGDYDGDGDLDLLLIGNNGSGGVSKLYRLDKDSGGVISFTDINAPLVAVYISSAAWGDYDGDGDLDILLTGFTGSTRVSKIYRNDKDQNGVISFTDIGAPLVAVDAGSVAWGDFDGDSDLDILLTGSVGQGGVSKIYRNDRDQNGSSSFIDIGAPFVGVYNSAAAWGDFDGDGDLDTLITGHQSSGVAVSKIYRTDRDGNGGTSFVDIGAPLLPVAIGAVAWGDYDKDSDLDLIITGQDGSQGSSKIYRNDRDQSGAISFVDIQAPIQGVAFSAVAWADHDSDGDLDIILTGGSNSTSYAKIYRSDLEQGGGINFVDVTANPLAQVHSGDAAWGDYDGDGDLDIAIIGHNNSQSLAKIYRSDRALSGEIVYTDIGASLEPVASGDAAWGDYDRDGDLDLLLTGQGIDGYRADLYRNDKDLNGQISFSDAGAGIEGVVTSAAAWGDYDQDGDLDLAITGFALLPGGFEDVSRIYRADKDATGSITFTDINAPLIGGQYGSIDWGDFDADGDLDLLLSAPAAASGVPGLFSKIYRADKDVAALITFTEFPAQLLGNAQGSSRWGDYDGDGDLDILLTGTSGSKVYRNERDQSEAVTFLDIGASLIAGENGAAEFGDYDADGDLDLVISGLDGVKVYRFDTTQNGATSYTDIATLNVSLPSSSAEWGDYDADGDLDLLISGYFRGSPNTTIYRNLTCEQPGANCNCNASSPDGDNDGTPDCSDMCPVDPGKTSAGVCGCGVADTDSDGDGTPNCNDACPNDSAKLAAGVCGCGVADTDSDGDGTPNCNDSCPNDNAKVTAGVCGCGVADTDSDGDGTPDCNDLCPNDNAKVAAGVCGCGVADTDSDGDGTPNCNDSCPNDSSKLAAGLCGCGVADTDSDGDGTPNCNDACPANPGKVAPGICGCSRPDNDTNNNGILDCKDKNLPPAVDAGPDATVTFPFVVMLNGSASDDGNPYGTLTTTWSKAKGPGVIGFNNPSALSTAASFSAPGLYELQLKASDGKQTKTSKMRVQVNASGLAQAVTGLSLVNAATGQPIPGFENLTSGAVLSLSSLGTTKVNIRAYTTPSPVGSVLLDVNGAKGKDSAEPYLAFTANWKPKLGVNRILATPYSLPAAKGVVGASLLISLKVVK